MEAKNWKTEKETIIRCVLLNLAGVFIYAVGINSFAAPHKIAPGGASGIAILINYLTGCPIGLFVFVFNILIVGLATADNDRVEIFTGVVFINRSKGIRFLFYDRQVREDILVFLAHVFHSCIQLHIIDRP